ncbi:type IV toxin-antitoxin system AbiEi family antitoxin, partial [uncultured Tateyamaria sp.]|uniref:type IV toxin-antitoxin system AbiEi family antitoxin n=1 Tax=uncultured Tateyamaria sp. TaxID=455651 RepID=UPI002607C3B6
KDIHCGNVKITFIANKQAANIPTRPFNTPRGILKVSTPEATALDLIAYSDRVGGLDMVATVLSDLADEINPRELARLSETAPIARVQRLGFLLDHVEHSKVSEMLQPLVEREARDYTSLAPDRPSHQSAKDKRWKVYVNASVEIDE